MNSRFMMHSSGILEVCLKSTNWRWARRWSSKFPALMISWSAFATQSSIQINQKETYFGSQDPQTYFWSICVWKVIILSNTQNLRIDASHSRLIPEPMGFQTCSIIFYKVRSNCKWSRSIFNSCPGSPVKWSQAVFFQYSRAVIHLFFTLERWRLMF